MAVLAAVWIAMGLLLTHVVLHGRLGGRDEAVNQWMADHRTALQNTVSSWAGNLGATLTIITIAAVATLVLLVRRRWAAALFVALAPLTEVVAFLATTAVVDRPRPDVVKLDTVPPTSSFPSGHTAAAVATYGALALVVDERARRRLVKVVMWVLALLIPALVMWARLYRGMHHPTDVVAGLLLGLASLLVAAKAVSAAEQAAARRADRTARASGHDPSVPSAPPAPVVAP